MINGISHVFDKQGVIINIPAIYPNLRFKDYFPPRDIEYKSKTSKFVVIKIVLDFEIDKENGNDDYPQQCVPSLVQVYINRADFGGMPISDLYLADWDGSNWNRLTLGLERFEFQTPLSVGGKVYNGCIQAITCIPGDPPIAVGT
jgi:hypothetical protein